MCQIESPVQLGPETIDALAAVHAWGRAFNERDLDRLLSVSARDIELATPNGAHRGHDAVRRLVHLQSYGVAQHVRPRRYIAGGATVAVEALLELRWVEGGELADTTEGVGVFDVRDGRISRFCPQPDLAAAFRVAGWPWPDRSAGASGNEITSSREMRCTH
jgi:limonene-1,2-epoxide hydrolase